jgi:hypothetical protein
MPFVHGAVNYPVPSQFKQEPDAGFDENGQPAERIQRGQTETERFQRRNH